MTKQRFEAGEALLTLLGSVAFGAVLGLAADRTADTQIPADTCILELTLPDGATVTMDGRDYGTQRRFEFRQLKPGKKYATSIQVRCADGSREERKISLVLGRLLRETLGPASTLADAPRAEPAPKDGKPELVLQTGHAKGASCAALSPDARHLASGDNDGTLILWDVATGHKLRSFEDHPATSEGRFKGVKAIAFSPDGNLILAGGDDKTAVLWDKVTGAKLGTFQVTGSVNSVAFSPDGAKLLIGSDDDATLWETRSGRRLGTFRPSSRSNVRSGVKTAVLSASGSFVVTGHQNGTATVWNAKTGSALRTITLDQTDFNDAALETLAQSLGSRNPEMSERVEKTFLEQLRLPAVEGAALSPDESILATAASNGGLTLWDRSSGRKLRDLDVQSRVGLGRTNALAFTRDGQRLLCCAQDNATLWEVASGQKLQATTSPTLGVAFDPTGTRMVTGHEDGTVSLWDTARMKKLWTIPVANRSVSLVGISPDGKQFAAGGLMGRSVTLRDLEMGAKLGEFQVPPLMQNMHPSMRNVIRAQGENMEDKGTVLAAVFNTDGRSLVTGSMHMDMEEIYQSAIRRTRGQTTRKHGQTLRLTAWDTSTGQQIWTKDTEFGLSRGMAFAVSRDRRMFLIGDPSGTSIWDSISGQELHRLPGRIYPQPLQSVAFSPDGRSLLTCSEEKSASLLELATGGETRRLTGHQGEVTCVAFSPDGRKIITGSADQTAILWDTLTGERIRELKGHEEAVILVEFSPDGTRVLVSAGDYTTSLWNTETGERLHTFPGVSGLYAYAFSLSGSFTQDSRLVLTRNVDSFGCKVWDVVTGESRYDSRGNSGAPIGAALSPEGAPLVLGRGHWKDVVVTDADSGAVLCRIEEDSTMLQSLSVASESMATLACMTSRSHGAVVWDGAFNRCTHLQPSGSLPLFTSMFSAAVISPDGRRVVTAAYGGLVTLWDASSGEQVRIFKGIDRDVRALVFSPDSQRLLTGLEGNDAILWDVASGDKLHTLETEDAVDAAAFGPRGDFVLTNGSDRGSSGDRAAVLWNARTGEKVRKFSAGSVSCVAFASDGNQAATAGHDQSIIVWDVAKAEQIRSIKVHDSTECLAFSPEARIIAAGHWQGSVTLWNVSSGEQVATCRGHTGRVVFVGFRSNGTMLMTGSDDGSVRLWDTSTGLELARLIHLDGGKDWLAVTPDGLFDGSAGGRENVMFRFGGGLNVVPVDRFFQDFYYPGLLAAIARGERPQTKVELASSLPPTVKILSPRTGGPVETDTVTLEVEVVDEGGGARGPWLVQNGARVLVPGETRRDERTIRRSFEVPLVEGANKLEICAASADGSWESEPAVITFRYERPLPKSELYLLAVGLNRYVDESLNLRHAAPDAQAIAELFRSRGPALHSQVRIGLLVDEQATKPNILKAVQLAAQEAQPQDTLLVFLAGQGAMVDQQYYFLPHEFRRQAETLDQDVRQQGLLAADLGDALAAVPALKRMVVFDTGQSGGRTGLTRTARDPFAFRGAIERLSRAQGVFTIAAAAVSDQVQEVPDLGHGVLTYALLAGLRAAEGGPLKDRWIEPSGEDRVARVLEWYGFASTHVPRLTKELFGQQSQEVQLGGTGGTSFPVLPLSAAEELAHAAPAETAVPVPKPRPAPVVVGRGTSKLYLVAVGIDRYAQEAMNLKYAASDAQAIAELFRRRGPRHYREVHAQEILDAQATRTGILQTLEEVARQAHADDVLVVFLAGHGRMVGQRYYFIPHEFRGQAETLDEDIRQQGLAADVLGDALSGVSARKRLLIFDTCASGGALGLSRENRDAFAFRGAIEKLGQQQGVFTIAASSAGAEAQEIEELGHGVLTYALLAALKAVRSGPLEGLSVQPASPDGMADVLEWFSYASGHVPRLTKRYLGREQEVQVAGQGVSFPVLPTSE